MITGSDCPSTQS